MTTHPKPARVDLGDGDSLILFRTSDHHTTVRFHSANANTQLAGAVMETGALRAALDEVAPAGSYTRTDGEDWQARAVKAEKALAWMTAHRDQCRGTAIKWQMEANRAEQARALTPDDISEAEWDQIAARAWAYWENHTVLNSHGLKRMMQAALTAPTRPEGVEEIEEKVATAAREAGVLLDVEDVRKFADSLTAQHVGVTGAES